MTYSVLSCHIHHIPLYLIISHHVLSFPITSCHVTSCCSMAQTCFAMCRVAPFEADQPSTSQLYLLIYGTRYLLLQFIELLQSKHIYCNVTLVKENNIKGKKGDWSMSIDRKQRESCPQIHLSCSLRTRRVTQAWEVSEFPGSVVRVGRLQL